MFRSYRSREVLSVVDGCAGAAQHDDNEEVDEDSDQGLPTLLPSGPGLHLHLMALFREVSLAPNMSFMLGWFGF